MRLAVLLVAFFAALAPASAAHAAPTSTAACDSARPYTPMTVSQQGDVRVNLGPLDLGATAPCGSGTSTSIAPAGQAAVLALAAFLAIGVTLRLRPRRA